MISTTGGGYLVIGVQEENGLPLKPIIGLPVNSLDAYQKELLELYRTKITPSYMPIGEPVMYKEKHLLFIWAPGGYERPYKARISLSKSNKETAYYVRRFSNTVMATASDIKELHELGGNIPFDDRVNHNAQLSDLRLGTMNEYLTAVGSSLANEDLSTRELAEAMKVTNGPSENVRPINVGLMFFNDDPSNFFREAIIEVVDIPDLTGEGMTERTFRGPLNYQLENAMAYIRNSIVAEKVFKHADRAEATRVFNYPYPAIEEALSNAVYHKSYQIPEPITVRIEKDNLSILSVPGPDRSISDEDIKRNHLKAKRYRNRRIGDE